MNAWPDPKTWRGLLYGEGYWTWASIRSEGAWRGTVAELEAGFVTIQREQTLPGHCCLGLKRHAVELHELGEREAEAFMRDVRRVGRAAQRTTGAAKMNPEAYRNTIPHLHAHFYPRQVDDRFGCGPMDARREPVVLGEGEFRGVVGGLREALEEA